MHLFMHDAKNNYHYINSEKYLKTLPYINLCTVLINSLNIKVKVIQSIQFFHTQLKHCDVMQ